jgi:hypothetical protein
MDLSKWADRYRNELHTEAPRAGVIRDLLAVVDREIRDAETVESDDGRLEHAHAACLAVAKAALSVSGYRMHSGAEAHHYRLLGSLEYTLGLTPCEIDELQDYRSKRSRAMYDQVGVVTDTDAQAALTAARQLRQRLLHWLRSNHADLLKE